MTKNRLQTYDRWLKTLEWKSIFIRENTDQRKLIFWNIFRSAVFQKKHVYRGVPRKSCSESMQQIYRRTPVPKCDFNKVAKQLYSNHTLAWMFSCKFAAYFQNTFPKSTSGGLLLPF